MKSASRPMNADAMRSTIKRPWCSDKTPMTPERILQIAKLKGSFTVHRYLYRADALRRTCRRMVANGLLRGPRKEGESLVFVAAGTDGEA